MQCNMDHPCQILRRGEAEPEHCVCASASVVWILYCSFSQGKSNGGLVGYIMGLARIIFNKSNKTLWYVTLSIIWFNTVWDFD